MTNQAQESLSTNRAKQPSAFSPYVFSFMYSNCAMVFGHPIERAKVGVQINLKIPQIRIISTLIQGGATDLFAGFLTCSLRQNIKIVPRTIIMSTLPNWVDHYHLHPVIDATLKALCSSSLDTVITTPFETVKTKQMQANGKISFGHVTNTIYSKAGLTGFFTGTSATLIKSFPTWFFLFFTYSATQDLREKNNLLSAMFWATSTSVPITVLTNPLDVIKTRRQARLYPTGESTCAMAKNLVQNQGWFSLFRGIPFRLVHKSLATAAGYIIMDMTSKPTEEPSPGCR